MKAAAGHATTACAVRTLRVPCAVGARGTVGCAPRTGSLAKLTATLDIERYPAPILRVNALADITMKRRIRPIGHALHMTMLYRIPMDVIRVPLKILLITNLMLPESALPKRALVTFGP